MDPRKLTELDLVMIATSAMRCSILPNMRCLYIEHIREKNLINLFAYFDTPLVDSQKEEIGCMVTEMSVLCGNIEIQEETILLPYPEKAPDRGICVYQRYEPNPNPEKVEQSTIFIAANRAMLGRIHQNLREIDVVYDEPANKMTVLSYFDTNPSTNQIIDITDIISEMKRHFSEDIFWEEKTIFLPFPNPIPRKSICVYYRHEP
jgi:hypothetical protein